MDPCPAAADADPFRDDRSFEYTVDHRVDPDARERFLTTMAKLAEAESRWPGFLAGRPPQRLLRGPVELWRSRIRWRDLESWLAWMESEERRGLLSEAQASDRFAYAGRTNWRGYARWLASEQAARTPTWKSNLLVLLVLYPTVMVLGPLLRALPLARPGAVLLSASLSVAITGWWLVPLAARLYDGWLTGRAGRGAGACSLASILLALTLMWALFGRFGPA
jgi:antibiotic biosynthesis monooxygenase (ABM) superfamily enzyme